MALALVAVAGLTLVGLQRDDPVDEVPSGPGADGEVAIDEDAGDEDGGTTTGPTERRAIPRCADGGDGCLRWRLALDDGMQPSLAGTDVLVVPDGTRIRAVDPADAAVRWETDLDPLENPASPIAHVVDDLVLVQARETDATDGTDGTDPVAWLIALDLDDGGERWRVPIGDEDVLVTEAEASDDRVVLAVSAFADDAASRDRLEALDLADGSSRWRVEAHLVSVGPGGPVTVDDGEVSGIAAADGAATWRAEPDVEPEQLWSVGDHVVVHLDGYAEVRHAATGERVVEELHGGLALPLPDGRLAVGETRDLVVVDGDDRVAESPVEDVCCTGLAVHDDRWLVARTLAGQLLTFDLREDAPGPAVAAPDVEFENVTFVGGLLVEQRERATSIHDGYTGELVAEIDQTAAAIGELDDVVVFSTSAELFAVPRPTPGGAR
ncbi:PQQ-binding-like beta-propeller repeat protein [Nitriliruptoraceae bacterium ZYF776]|nr:PQQ-binding-like beta-propeller repeat protein [Profundirhabdus halotolerans]